MRAALLLAALTLATTPPGHEPAIGRLLIATPQVSGFFTESVVVLVDHGENGSLGLIVNRPLALSVAELLPELPSAASHKEPSFFGGPVAPGQMLLLVRAARPPPGAAPVLEGVSVSGSRDTLRALLEHPPVGGALRAYVGYAGWAPGQLAAEIARGDWLVAPGDAASVFTQEPAELWEQLLRKHRAIEVRAPQRGARSEARAAVTSGRAGRMPPLHTARLRSPEARCALRLRSAGARHAACALLPLRHAPGPPRTRESRLPARAVSR